MNLPELASHTVLVVDDAPDALSLISDTLDSAGIDTLVALDGKQALAIARRLKPDMILLDANMPHLDGFETCLQLKSDASLSSIPVIFMTGLTDTDHVLKGLSAGGVDYLAKPVNPDELLARMRVHLLNAQLTTSARNALDSLGQHIFTVDEGGNILWATPQSLAFLAKINASDVWIQQELSPQLAQWLGSEPRLDSHIILPVGDRLLEITLLEKRRGEWLLKLKDGQTPKGEELLHQQLNLTARESEVLYWLANGKSNREISEILDMGVRTVNKHLEQIYPKLGVENRTAAAGIAIRILQKSQ